MTTRIFIPVKSVRGLPSNNLDIDFPKRCSRCDRPSAPCHETHPLHYQAGLVPHHNVRRKFSTDVHFRLRLPLCEDCYRRNFIEVPESVEKDRNPLAAFARWCMVGLRAGILFALAAFLLLLKIFKLPILEANPYLWLYLSAAALALIGITALATSLKNRWINQILTNNGYNFKLHRATAFAMLQSQDAAPDDIAVTLELENDGWAGECAKNYSWESQLVDDQPEKEK
jgi:hypothetical protein